MDVSLTKEQTALVQRLIKIGRYDSESEAVGKAFQLLAVEDVVEATRRNIREGLDQASRGESAPFNQTLVDQIKSDGRDVLAERHNTKTA